MLTCDVFLNMHVGKKSHVDMRFFHVNMQFFLNMHVEKKSHVNMEHLFLMLVQAPPPLYLQPLHCVGPSQ